MEESASLLQLRCRGRLEARRLHASKEACHAEIFVDVRPMNPFPVAKQFEFRPLLSCRMKQAWKPHEWNGNGTAVDETYGQFIFGNDDFLRERSSLNQSAHSMISEIHFDA